MFIIYNSLKGQTYCSGQNKNVVFDVEIKGITLLRKYVDNIDLFPHVISFRFRR